MFLHVTPAGLCHHYCTILASIIVRVEYSFIFIEVNVFLFVVAKNISINYDKSGEFLYGCIEDFYTVK